MTDGTGQERGLGAIYGSLATAWLPEQLSCAVPTMVQPPPQVVITLQLVWSNAKIENSVIGPLGASH
ncbi:MAG: hypothetical protein WBW31_19155 [Candidatus Sulfotelmatobacter sp.]